jgi:ribosomal protein S18
MNDTNKAIKDLLKPGKLRSELENARKYNKEMFEAEMANNKFMEMENKKRRKNTQQKKEKFTAELDGDNARAIQQRKFNPASQLDMNLLETMEICEDIRDRIKYNYEDTKYLKRYIKEKLEEVVDLLDLVSDDN